MAILGIRTAWGPKAKAEARDFKLDKLAREERLALEKEFTKQVLKGDAATAAAVMGGGYTPPATGFLDSIDINDPTTQVVGGLLAVGVAIAAKRYMG